jgi:predicted dehydrogenase
MQGVRLGFIGAGFIARFHATALKQVRGVELAGVVSPHRAEEFAQFARNSRLGDCLAYKTVGELCRNCDVVCILAPNHLRVELMTEISAAVKAGSALKAIACEKPLGRNVEEAEQLVRLATATTLPTIYLENQIHMKPFKRQLEQLAPQQKAMGPMTLVRAAEEHGGPHEPWFWDPVRQGGGVLSDMGCHSIAAAWYALTPPGKPLTYLEPVSVQAETALLKWGQRRWREQLKDRTGVDYATSPAEDFATGVVTFRNPDTMQLVKAQFTTSWMYEKQGLRVYMDGVGPGYAFEFNSLQSPLSVFIGDAAADAVADAESALEKSTASRGLLAVHPNEADLYGYTDEFEDLRDAVLFGTKPLADWNYGLEITRLCQAAYMSAEAGRTVNLQDPMIRRELVTYKSAISQGRGREVLSVID